MLSRTVLLATILLLPRTAAAQTTTLDRVDDREMSVVSHLPPVYPQIARSARLEGVVVLDVGFDATGKVTKTSILSGWPMLQEAAADAVARWTFAPNRQGRAIVVADFRISSECVDQGPAPLPVLRRNMITVYACSMTMQP